jgi:hypothetical protein
MRTKRSFFAHKTKSREQVKALKRMGFTWEKTKDPKIFRYQIPQKFVLLADEQRPEKAFHAYDDLGRRRVEVDQGRVQVLTCIKVSVGSATVSMGATVLFTAPVPSPEEDPGTAYRIAESWADEVFPLWKNRGAYWETPRNVLLGRAESAK